MKVDLCQRHSKMLERLGEAIRPLTKELASCDEHGCAFDAQSLDEIVINVERAWRAGVRAGLWAAAERRERIKR